jgi:simple sugar transport system ATP-binding protein
VLRRLTLEGASVVFITHKLDEVMAVADRVTVLRDGRRVATLRIGETSPPSLARLMVGREVLSRVERPAAAPGPVRLALRGVSAGEAGPWPALRRISLEVRAGEIFGVAGVAGNGQTELAQVITGLLPAREGRIEIDGTDITRLPPRTRFAYGLAHIPEDRRQAGLVGEMTVRANAMLGHHRRRPFSNGWVFSREADACVEQMLRDYAIAVPSAQVKARHLSGGNQQRLILARELFQRPRLMVTVQPTWGLDVAATEYVHRQLVAQRAAGAAILLISTELAELLALSDRLGVMHAGELVATGAPASFTLEEIGLCMAGARR